ncbi:TetR/AcrR family transcriptional regulator [Paenibacillus sacheonensis]|uniref:TetR family transcriptional regulator n=1 Tax=Paenibacillus sacheonensis TaxID=742054 RepID=A0A7X4YRV2_9BACL|nr:TetR/AcrR family transcriptional regulator [Paenibacillus sacheonensis]MBM7567517.1 AcrR family transcriptional regulator [Paenibacillus sacheonensis]NBC71378.1 TetR family transcriptional regulator [Paenibacillus sacheonensis]
MKDTRNNILLASQELLAKFGYAGYSLGAVAELLNVSKGVVTYHFPQKEHLIQTLITAYFSDAAEYMAKHMVIDRTAPEALASYIEANLRYAADNRKRTLAIMRIIANHRSKDGALAFTDQDNQIHQPLIEIFQYGQSEEGSFRTFAPELMAMLVRSAIDIVSGRIATHGIEDTEEAIQETVRTFMLATRREGHEEDSK